MKTLSQETQSAC